MSLLEIENLSLAIGDTPILKGVELSVAPGEVMGLVGESGSGKSMTALTVMQLLPHAARASGRVTFDGIDILAATEDQMCALRGDDIGMVFQEPMTALNPVKTIGEQVAEGIRWHTKASRAEAEDRARKMLDRVGLPSAKFPMSRYPHELSGGQRQRVVIAIACALKPKLLIADEPTTALDVVLQAQILDLLRDLVAESRWRDAARRSSGRRGATCRWCSRIPTARSTRATRWRDWWPSRCICWMRSPTPPSGASW